MYCSRCGTEVEQSAKFCPSCGLDLAASTPLGRTSDEPASESEMDLVRDTLANEYEVRKELGRGGMAIVFQAMDKQLEREVAIKVLPFSLAFDKEFVERFQREARTAARLEHPHIIPIYRVGKSGRVIYFVMKFLRGGSLSDEIDERGKLPPDEIRKLLIQTAGALGYAHQHGIVHRDIKPDNIMFDVGHAIVTDFGIAKAASGTRLTGTGMSIGTPHYMSPEQARAQPLDGRSDIYSLGVLAFQCLTGRVPFDGEDAFAIGYKHIMEELPTPDLAGNDERQLFRIVKKMMAKSADERFQNAEELVAVIEGKATVSLPKITEPTMVSGDAPTVALPSLEGERASTPPQPRPGSAVLRRPSTPTTPMPRPQKGPPPKKKKRSGALVAASLLVLLGGGGAGGWYYYTNVLEPQGGVQALFGGDGTPVAADSAVDTTAVAPLALADSLGPDSARRDSLSGDTASGDSGRADSAAVPLPDYGVVVIQGVPSGGRWFIDREVQSADTVRVEPGSHRIGVSATNYRDWSEMHSVGRGDTVTVTARPARVRTADCESPTSRDYNLNDACFDQGPRFQGTPFVALDQSVQAEQPRVTLWIHVDASGRPSRPSVKDRSDDPAFHQLAIRHALQQSYQPAMKGGQPVDAWFQQRFIGRRQ